MLHKFLWVFFVVSLFVSFEEKAAGAGAVPVDQDEVKGVPCFCGDALPDPGQHRDPRLGVERDP